MHEAALKTRTGDFSRAFLVRVLSGVWPIAGGNVRVDRGAGFEQRVHCPNPIDGSSLEERNGGVADMTISGKSVIIPDGDITPTGNDDTDFFDRIVCLPGSVSHTFTIRNTGTVPLTITAFGKSGPHASDFTINAPTRFSVMRTF